MAELTSSTREAARRLGVSDTTMHKAERTGRITREPDGQWDIAKTRARMLDTADPQRSALAGSTAAEGTPFARLKVAQLALKVEAQRLALDESKGRLLDVATANATIDEIASTMRDALLNWPARVAGVIAAELNVEPHLLQTILQQHINELLTEASDRFDPPGIGGEREPHA
jgi:DNA-binding XRE family transcriptional regulator